MESLRSYEPRHKSLTFHAGEAAWHVGSDALICSDEARKNGEWQGKEKKKKKKAIFLLRFTLDFLFFFFSTPITATTGGCLLMNPRSTHAREGRRQMN